MFMHMDEYEENGAKKKDIEIAPKPALLFWIKFKMSLKIPVNNFTTDWNDGRAIAALVDTVEPGLFPDVDPKDLDPNDAVNNAKKAMKTAEKYLGVPPVSFKFWKNTSTAVMQKYMVHRIEYIW